jgi:hypothetical protein
MENYKHYIRGLGDTQVADPVDATTMPDDSAMETIGEVKEGGIAITPGSTTKEYLKKEGPNGLEIVDVIVTKENDVAKGKLIVRDLDRFAKSTGGSVTITGAGADKKARYKGPNGVNTFSKALRFITTTKVGDSFVTRDYPMTKMTVLDDFVLSAKNWWEASVEFELISAGETVYPQPE